MSCHTEKSLVDVFRVSVARYPQKIALRYFGRDINYQELYDSARRFAGFLLSRNLKVGDRIGLLMPNIPQYAIAYFGTMMAGCIPVPLDIRDVPKRIEQVLDKTKPRLIVVSLREYHHLQQYVQEKAWFKKKKTNDRLNFQQKFLDFSAWPIGIVGVDAADYFGFWKRLAYRHNPFDKFKKFTYDYWWHSALRNPPLSEEKFRFCETALLQSADSSEGREGEPVIATLTHKQLIANLEQIHLTLSQFMSKDARVLSPLPWTHIFGATTCLNAPIAVGATIVISLKEIRFPIALLRMLQEEKITVFIGINKMFDALVMACRDLKNKEMEIGKFNLNLCVSGGGLMRAERKREFFEHFGVPVSEGHGLSEAPVICLNWPGSSKEGTLGKLMPGTEGMMVDGNLFIRGEQLMVGYYKDDEETNKAMNGGWLNLGGDISLDGENFLIPKDPQHIRTCIAEEKNN